MVKLPPKKRNGRRRQQKCVIGRVRVGTVVRKVSLRVTVVRTVKRVCHRVAVIRINKEEKLNYRILYVTDKRMPRIVIAPMSKIDSERGRLMDFVLCGLSYITCLVYLDDVIVFGKVLRNSFTAWIRYSPDFSPPS